MAKVIRLITYEGTEEVLKHWLEHILPDGVSEMLPGITIQTIHADIESEKFGTDGRDELHEGPYKEINTLVTSQILNRFV